jgi:hypothetical protein
MGEARRRREAARLRAETQPAGSCTICLKPADVCSHLLPAAIAQDIRGDEKHVLIGSKDHDGRNYSQTGTWERMLCGDHEAMIHDYEEYAIEFLREFALTPAERAAGSFIRKNLDTKALIRFACSVLWRYHTSTRVEASKVDLGAWEPDLRAVTFDGDMSRAPDVIIGAHLQNLYPSYRYAYPPHRSEFDDRVVWQLVIHGVIFLVKLDRRPFPLAGPIMLGPDGDVIGYVKTMSQEELSGVRQMVLNMATPHPLRSSVNPY